VTLGGAETEGGAVTTGGAETGNGGGSGGGGGPTSAAGAVSKVRAPAAVPGSDVALLASGMMVAPARAAARVLRSAVVSR